MVESVLSVNMYQWW